MPPGGGSTLESVAGKGFVDLAALQFAVLLAQKQLGRAMAGRCPSRVGSGGSQPVADAAVLPPPTGSSRG